MPRVHHTIRSRGAGLGAYGQSAHGFALLTTLLLVVLLTTSVITAITVGGLQNRVTGNLQKGLQATYLAEAGMQHAWYQLCRDSQWRASIAGTPLGQGTYQVTVSQASPTADISLLTTAQVAGAQRTVTETLRYEILTVAGTGTAGFNGNGSAATAAQLDTPTGVFGDAQGNLFIADQNNHRIRKITAGADGVVTGAADEIITTIAGTGTAGFNGDGGTATAAQLDTPTGVFGDAQGNIFIADRENHRIRKVNATTGLISTVAGTGVAGYSNDGLLATIAKLNRPLGVFVDAQGNLFIADRENNRIRKVSALLGLISTVAGTGSGNYSGDGGLATLAKINKPAGVFGDAQGNLFIADQNNHRIRKVSALLGLISTVAGTGSAGYSGDGIPATTAQLQLPHGVFVDAQGRLFIADQGNHRIRRVTPGADGVITGAADEMIGTIVGTGVADYSGDGGSALAAQINAAKSVFVDVAGNLFIADSGNHRVRRTHWRMISWQES